MKIGLNCYNYILKSSQQKKNLLYSTRSRQIQPNFCGDCFVPSVKSLRNDGYVGKGEIHDKENKDKLPVNIYKMNEADFITTYKFLSTKDSEQVGHVTFALLDEPKKYDSCYEGYEKKVLDDYPELDIVGPRLVVDYLKNNNEQKYGGVGLLADRLSVKHCLDNGFPPLIISEAVKNSHIAHYKRGKRFLPLKPESDEYNFFMKKYGSADVNMIIKTGLEQSNGEKLDISDWPDLIMRLSDEKINEYKKMLG